MTIPATSSTFARVFLFAIKLGNTDHHHHHHHPRISSRHKSWTKLQGRYVSRITLFRAAMCHVLHYSCNVNAAVADSLHCRMICGTVPFSEHAWMPSVTAATWSPAAAHSKSLPRQRGRWDRQNKLTNFATSLPGCCYHLHPTSPSSITHLEADTYSTIPQSSITLQKTVHACDK